MTSNELKARRVQQVYQRHTDTSYNAKHVEQYPRVEPLDNFPRQEAERRNRHLQYWDSRILKRIWGVCDCNNWQNNQQYGAPNVHQEIEKIRW